MLKTSNYKLNKPELSDTADITKLNENADIIDSELFNKVNKEAGKGLSSEDFTTTFKMILEGFTGKEALALQRFAGDLNTLYAAGLYSINNCTNAPLGISRQYSAVLVLKADGGIDPLQKTDSIQVFFDVDNNVFVRNSIDENDGTWTLWKKVGSEKAVWVQGLFTEGLVRPKENDTLIRHLAVKIPESGVYSVNVNIKYAFSSLGPSSIPTSLSPQFFLTLKRSGASGSEELGAIDRELIYNSGASFVYHTRAGIVNIAKLFKKDDEISITQNLIGVSAQNRLSLIGNYGTGSISPTSILAVKISDY